MANAGWYPDPSGQPGLFRYWDGASWSAQTSGTADAPPPGQPPAPPLPQSPPAGPDAPTVFPGAVSAGPAPTQMTPSGQGYQSASTPPTPPPGPPSWGGTPSVPSPSGSSASKGSGRLIGLIVGLAVLVIALGVGGVLVLRGLSGDDDDDTKPEPTRTETTTPTSTVTSAGPITADPSSDACIGGDATDGREDYDGTALRGGGLTTTKTARVYRKFKLTDPTTGKTGVYSQDDAFPFADGVTTLSKLIDSQFVSGYMLGSLAKDREYEDVSQAAETVFSCFSQQPGAYEQPAETQEQSSEAITVDGHDAWQVVGEIRGAGTNGSGIEGDHVVLVVVDTGDPDRFGVYLNYIPIGYDELLPEQQQVTDALTVE